MKIHYEIVTTDENSSFRFLYQNKPVRDYIWEYHYHPEYELVCVFSGKGTRHIGSHLSMYDDGDLVFIGSNVPHAGFGLNASDPHEEIVVQIGPEVMQNLINGFSEMKDLANFTERAKHGIKFNGQIKLAVKAQLIAMRNFEPFERMLALMNLLNQLAKSTEYDILNKEPIAADFVNKHRSRLQKIFTHVENNYHREVDIEQVAKLANISVPSFCNYFKKTTQFTFTDFVNRYRIQKACSFLLQDKTIAEICFCCGFNNVTYFNKIFRKLTHKTPTEFRKESA